MTAHTETTAKVPRGLPEEQPVELVAVSSRAGRLGVALLAAILVSIWFATLYIGSKIDVIAAVLAVQRR